MYRSAGILFACLLSVSPALAQSTTPIAVEAAVPGGAAISAVNTDLTQQSIGLSTMGSVGLTVAGTFFGAQIQGGIGTGASVFGHGAGLEASCQASACVGLRGTSGGLSGRGVYGVGQYGVVGEALPMGAHDTVPIWAGYFIGDLHVDGAIDAPIIQQQPTTIASLESKVASLMAQVAALVSATGSHGIIPHTIPGRIEAEDYDAGGQGIGYYDTTPGNEQGFSVYRNDDVDIKTSQEGGYSIGWMAAGEWLDYTVNAPSDGLHAINVRVGSAEAGRTFHIEIDGHDATGPVAVPQKPDWDIYDTITIASVPLHAGNQTLRFVVGPDDWVEFQWFEVR